MMDVREKLVELITEGIRKGLRARGDDRLDYSFEDVADQLIANGVTVQKWIPVKERLPEHGDVVLCFMKFGEHRILQWDNVSSLWLGYGHGDDWQKADVTNWMPLPEPPKGE